jgi:hypothetical protein
MDLKNAGGKATKVDHKSELRPQPTGLTCIILATGKGASSNVKSGQCSHKLYGYVCSAYLHSRRLTHPIRWHQDRRAIFRYLCVGPPHLLLSVPHFVTKRARRTRSKDGGPHPFSVLLCLFAEEQCLVLPDVHVTDMMTRPHGAISDIGLTANVLLLLEPPGPGILLALGESPCRRELLICLRRRRLRVYGLRRGSE